ncbi:MAG: hypothetical protein MZV70_30520 [Desulfobacterales bacterium]|nr:hypothetical protein [Desulfobacterales bacterium]
MGEEGGSGFLIVPAKHGKFLKESIGIADLLLTDTDDMGIERVWLAPQRGEPEAHGRDLHLRQEKQKGDAPTALRYAIELDAKRDADRRNEKGLVAETQGSLHLHMPGTVIEQALTFLRSSHR